MNVYPLLCLWLTLEECQGDLAEKLTPSIQNVKAIWQKWVPTFLTHVGRISKGEPHKNEFNHNLVTD